MKHAKDLIKKQLTEYNNFPSISTMSSETKSLEKIELKAQANSLHALEHTARRADDAESMVAILEKLLHCYRLQVLNKEQERQEAGWSGKMADIKPLEGVMSAEELKRRLNFTGK